MCMADGRLITCTEYVSAAECFVITRRLRGRSKKKYKKVKKYNSVPPSHQSIITGLERQGRRSRVARVLPPGSRSLSDVGRAAVSGSECRRVSQKAPYWPQLGCTMRPVSTACSLVMILSVPEIVTDWTDRRQGKSRHTWCRKAKPLSSTWSRDNKPFLCLPASGRPPTFQIL